MRFGPFSAARPGNRSLRLPAITSVARWYGNHGMSSRSILEPYAGPAYQRTSWPRSRRWTAIPVSGLKWPSAGKDAIKIFMTFS